MTQTYIVKSHEKGFIAYEENHPELCETSESANVALEEAKITFDHYLKVKEDEK